MCKYVVETKEVKDKSGETKKIKGKMDCRTVGAIYGMWCKQCEKIIYMGKQVILGSHMVSGTRCPAWCDQVNK